MGDGGGGGGDRTLLLLLLGLRVLLVGGWNGEFGMVLVGWSGKERV